MDDIITLRIPRQWFQDLDRDQTATMQEIIRLGIYQLKVRRALEMYQAGAGSLVPYQSNSCTRDKEFTPQARKQAMG